MNNNNFPVSILVPVYGVEKYIERCARSLFEQTYSNIEYVFVDDCTPDRSIEVLQRVMEDYPGRKPYVRIIHHEMNRGLAAARNTALENCQTEFLMHVDSDDYIEKETIEKCIKKQKEDNYDIVFFNFVKHFSKYDIYVRNPNVNRKDVLLSKILNGTYTHSIWGCLIRTFLYARNGITAIEGVNMGEDFCVIPKLVYCAAKIASINDCLYHYSYQNISSYSYTFSQDKSRQQQIVFNDLECYFKDEPILLSLLRKTRKDAIIDSMIKCILAKDKTYYDELSRLLASVSDKSSSPGNIGQRIALILGCGSIGRKYVKLCYKGKEILRTLSMKYV